MLWRLIVFVLSLLTTGCVSNPIRTQFTDAYAAGFLPVDYSVLGKIHLKQLPRLQAILLENPSLRDAVARTERIWFSLKSEQQKLTSWTFLADGDFPKLGVELNLEWSTSWVKFSQEAMQWTHRDQPLFIAIPDENIILSSGQSFQKDHLLWRNTLFQDYPPTFWQNASLVLVVRSPIEVLLGPVMAQMLKVKEAVVFLDPSPEGFVGKVVLKMDSQRDAEGGLIVIRLLKGSLEILTGSWTPEKEVVHLLESFSRIEWTYEGDTILGQGFELDDSWVENLLRTYLPKE